jgi:hypothetical protein
LTLLGKISGLPKRWRASLAGALLVLLILLLYPFKTATVPAWGVQVIDDSGTQVPAINVTEHWQHYLLESEGHEEMRKTDGRGLVDFPARFVRASLVTRVVKTIITFVKGGAPARFGRYASLVVWGSPEHDTAVTTYVPGTYPPDKVVIHRR